ncbi:THO complex subunit 4 [Euphorbia peplus]|nr:THO complex subunit 4 [Euphorbia peplus]
MADNLDMSLDDIRRAARRGGRPQPTSSASHGPLRRSFLRETPRAHPYPLPEPTMLPPDRRNRDSPWGTKLYISNLDYGVSDRDLELLFSEEGELLWHSVHYDRSGRSKGTAEVVFARQEDALASVLRYHNSPLDGKLMKISLIGADLITPSLQVSAPSYYAGMPYGYGRNDQESYVPRGRGRFHGAGARSHGHNRGRGGHEQVRHRGEYITTEELDADLERYVRDAKKRK